MRSDLFRCQRRGGKGVIAIKFKRADDRLLALSPFDVAEPGGGGAGGGGTGGGAMAMAAAEASEQELLLITEKGVTVRQRLLSISEQSRATTGVLLQRLDEDDLVASVDIVAVQEDAGEEEEGKQMAAGDEGQGAETDE